jgi:hypothetical protein
MKRSWLVPLGGILLAAASLFLLPVAAQAATACVDLNNNGVCDDGAASIIPDPIGVLDLTAANPFGIGSFLIEAGATRTCQGGPTFGMSIKSQKITVNGTLQCLFAGGTGIALKSTGVGAANGIVIDGGTVKSGSSLLTLDSETTIAVTNGTVEGLFLGTAVVITSKGNQSYTGATVKAPNGLFMTSGGTVTAAGGGVFPCPNQSIVLPATVITDPASLAAWQAQLVLLNPGLTFQQIHDCLCAIVAAGTFFLSTETGEIRIKAPSLVDLSGAQIKAGRLILIESVSDQVKLVGSCLENTEGVVPPLPNQCGVNAFAPPGYLTNGGEIVVNSGAGKTIEITQATLRDGGDDGPPPHGSPTFNNRETCVANALARTVGAPFFCE